MKKWKKISEQIVRINRFRTMIKVRYELPNGQRDNFYLNNNGRIVCALVVTKENQMVLAEQYRPGPDKIFLELPGGKIEEGETPKQAVMREILEETGYRGKAQFIVATNDDAWSRKMRYHFVITDAVKIAEPHPDDLENCQVRLMPLNQFRQHLRSGKLTDVETGYLALDYLKLLTNNVDK
jgi:ADP-ribose pyrophosphatase